MSDIMTKINGRRTYNLFEVYYRRNGEKKFVWVPDKVNVERFKRELKRQKRKYLGNRPIVLQEVTV